MTEHPTLLWHPTPDGVNRYLAEPGRVTPMKTLADLIAFNEAHGITPESVKARISDILDSVYERDHVRADISGVSGKGFADGGHLVGNNLQAHLNALEKDMRNAAADLDFEKAARLRDEIKRLKAVELAAMDDPIAKQESRSQETSKGGSTPLRPAGGEKVPGRADEGHL